MLLTTPFIVALLTGAIILILLVAFIKPLVGLVIIKENQVGVVVKKFGPRLAAGQLIALKGEAGYQADTLAPGWHFFTFPGNLMCTKRP